jgi:hypothetical protein
MEDRKESHRGPRGLDPILEREGSSLSGSWVGLEVLGDSNEHIAESQVLLGDFQLFLSQFSVSRIGVEGLAQALGQNLDRLRVGFHRGRRLVRDEERKKERKRERKKESE